MLILFRVRYGTFWKKLPLENFSILLIIVIERHQEVKDLLPIHLFRVHCFAVDDLVLLFVFDEYLEPVVIVYEDVIHITGASFGEDFHQFFRELGGALINAAVVRFAVRGGSTGLSPARGPQE